MFPRLIIVFLTVILFVTGCGNNGSNDNVPAARSESTVSGTAFDGLILNGTINIYAYDGGIQGGLLGSGTTDDSGLYSVSIISEDRPILIEVTGGRYIEEASGSNVALNDDDRLTGATYYVSGQPVTISITYYTHLAVGLAEFLMSTGSDVKTALESANTRMSNLIGIDITRTTPLDVTLLSNATSQPTPGHLYGFATAAISQYTKFISEKNNSPVHSVYKSIVFARMAFDDVRADGRLNGQGDSGLLSLGTVAVSPKTYRHTLATNMFVMASSARNRTGLSSADILNTVVSLNNADDAIFGGTTPTSLGNTVPQISNLSISEGQTVWQNVNISADVTDIAGIDSVELRLDDVLLKTFAAGEAVDYAIDTTTYEDGTHKISVIATNIFNGVFQADVNVTFFNGQTVISNIAPPNGTYLRGLFTMTAGVGDPLGLSDVQFSIDSTPFTLSVDKENPSALIATNNYGDGPHTVELQATNNAGFITSKSVEYIFDNTDPVVNFIDLQNSDVLSSIESVQLTADDNLGIAITEVFLSGESVYSSDVVDSGQQSFFFDTTLHDDGPQMLTATVRDNAGNVSSTSLNIYIDQTPSSLVITSPIDGAMIAGDFTIFVTVDENIGVQSVEFFIDGGSLGMASDIADPSKPVDGSQLNDGTRIVTVTMTDSANRTTTETVSIIIDNTAPIVDFSGISDGNFLEGNTTLNFTAEDAGLLARVEIRLNNEVIAVVTNFDSLEYALDTTAYPEGAYTLSVTAVDKAGNSATSSYNIIIDQAPPTVLINNPVAGSALNSDFTIKATPTDTQGIASVEFKLNDISLGLAASTTNPQQSVAIGSMVEGDHTVSVIATDSSGRTTTRTVDFTVDVTDPVTSIANITNGDFLSGSKILNLTASDNLILESVDLHIGTTLLSSFTTFGTLNYSLDTTAYAEGEHTITVTATDTAGNSTTSNYNVIIDQAPPSLSITNPLTGDFISGEFTVRAEVEDTNGIESVEILLNGDHYAWTSTSAPETLISSNNACTINGTCLGDGPVIITLKATDTVGKVSVREVEVVFDNTEPLSVVNISSPDTGWATCPISGSTNDYGSGLVSLNINGDELSIGGSGRDWNYEFSFSGSSTKEQTLTVVSTDLAGNTNTLPICVRMWVKQSAGRPVGASCFVC